MNDITTPVMLITGAAGGLGRALTEKALAGGYDCVLIDRDRKGLERLHDRLAEAGPPPALYPMDLAGAGPDDYEELAGVLKAQFGKLDVLVHAAADFVALRRVEQQPVDEWMKIIQAGVNGPFLLTRALFPLLRAAPGNGKIVWLLDDPPARSQSYWGAYGVAQSARQALAAILFNECRSRGPNVLAFSPPPFAGGVRARAWPGEDPAELASAESVAESLLEEIEQA